MIRRKWRLITILFAFTLLIIIPITTLGASEDVNVWNTKTINNNKKVWTIAFNYPLKESSINKKTVYVEDDHYRFVFTDVALSNDKKSIIVTPKDFYQDNKTYRLYISKTVTSEKGKKLESDIVLPFVLNGTAENVDPDISKEAIISVTITPSAYASRITAISNDTVNKVTANGTEMHYEGNNTYSLGMIGLSSDENIRIVAYDIKEKVLFSKNYKVD